MYRWAKRSKKIEGGGGGGQGTWVNSKIMNTFKVNYRQLKERLAAYSMKEKKQPEKKI